MVIVVYVVSVVVYVVGWFSGWTVVVHVVLVVEWWLCMLFQWLAVGCRVCCFSS